MTQRWYYILRGHGTLHLATKWQNFLPPDEFACGILALNTVRRWRLRTWRSDQKRCKKCQAYAVAQRLS